MIDEKYGLLEESHVPVFEKLVKKYGGGIVLDLGCGPRHPEEGLLSLIQPKELISIDGTDCTTNYFATFNLPRNARFKKANLIDLPIEDNYADLALLLGVYDDCLLINEVSQYDLKRPRNVTREKFWERVINQRRKEILTEAARVLKPEGRLIASLRHKDYRTAPETIEQFEEFFNVEEVFQGSQRYLMNCEVKK